jgi:hypothetical protein
VSVWAEEAAAVSFDDKCDGVAALGFAAAAFLGGIV